MREFLRERIQGNKLVGVEVPSWDLGERAGRRFEFRSRLLKKLPFGFIRDIAMNLSWDRFIRDYLGDQGDAIQERNVLVLFGKLRFGLPFRRHPERYVPDHLPNLS